MFVTIGKVAQGVGVLQYWINRRLNRQTKLIEYKDVGPEEGLAEESLDKDVVHRDAGEVIS